MDKSEGNPANKSLGWWRFIAALPLTLVAILLGNLAGVVFTAVAGFESMAPDKPGGVVLAGFQAFFGIMLAYIGSQHLLGSYKYAGPWVLVMVLLLGAMILLAYPFLIFWRGHTELVNWNLASGISALVVMEVTRRMVKRDGLDGVY